MKQQLLLLFAIFLLSTDADAAEKINGIYYILDYDTQTAIVYRPALPAESVIVIPATIVFNNVEFRVKKIMRGAFEDCHYITSITIGGNVNTIGDNAFAGCSGLTSVTIPSNVTSIGEGIFKDCSGLISVIIDCSIESIPYCAFYKCSSMTSISITNPNCITEIGAYAFSGCKSLTSFTIGNSVKNIDKYAFAGCSSLESIIIPNSVQGIGESPFSGCTKLTRVEMDNNRIVSRNYKESGYDSFQKTFGFSAKEYILGNNVTSIGEYAFSNYKMTSITLSSSVTSLSRYSFKGCNSLNDVYCYAVDVPHIVYVFGEGAFLGSNKNATLHVPANSVEAYGKALDWKEFKIIVPIGDDDPKPTGIIGINNDIKVNGCYYSIEGKQQDHLRKGLNIIKMKDGTTRKVMVK